MALLMGFSSYTCSIRSPLKSHCIPESIPFLAFSSATAYVIHSKMVLNACSVAIVMDAGFWQYKDNAGLCEHDHAKELMSTSESCFQSFSVVSAPRSRESAVMLLSPTQCSVYSVARVPLGFTQKQKHNFHRDERIHASLPFLLFIALTFIVSGWFSSR